MRFGRQIISDAALLHCFMRLFAGRTARVAFLALCDDGFTLGHAGMIASQWRSLCVRLHREAGDHDAYDEKLRERDFHR